MLRRILWVIICIPPALFAIGTGAALSWPVTRHIVSAWWYLPDRLPALSDNGLVHYEPGAEDYARDVATLLPAALARVEATHGRPFAHPVTLGVYDSMDAYVAANGTGSTAPVGTAIFGRVNLSPKLSWPQHRRLPAILTHELSHAHIEGWIGNRYVLLPNWFKEGLAVMVSGGGGAELVGADEAWAAIQDGGQIAIDDAGSLLSWEIRFATAPARQDPSWYPVVLAYRQAGMFVTYLRASDEAAFDRMMNAILDGRAFADAVTVAYHDDVRSLWLRFVESSPHRKAELGSQPNLPP
ncbi:hypothetical protein LQG66_33595 [Bradyrhizobium ontarionense]|uniref:Peptidase MA-like domain-containing protein n=1 Tax=Bradyrhizobium ontarionense TaxID=2898149 RepID=A0ABY3RAI9_9BRAD|nr:hypothetical protein [Bradyrhizobium sp. A19]UFZ04073.1 hypothetical protein LQG66_33595 [Bradyrhizobium sp. A19]